ncbi:MAG: hypothetical protein AAFV53_05750 [Myxococcota bacterium]
MPIDRPSLNVVFYANGRPEMYLLQEYDPADVSWKHLEWKMGENQMKAAVDPDRQRLSVQVDLNCPVPGTNHRLTGQLSIDGPLRKGGDDEGRDPNHEWAPLTVVARGTADLRCGRQAFSIDGRAYHDRNIGRRPLHDLGIDRWWWGRLAFPDREFIFYYLLPHEKGAPPRSVSLSIDAGGDVRWAEDAAVEIRGRRWSPYGLWWPTKMRVNDPEHRPVDVDFSAVVDDGPFYHRYLIRGRCGREDARGVAELVVPDRVDQDWMRPLVRMRVHHTHSANSFFLPLFSGPRRGRLGRLLSFGRP